MKAEEDLKITASDQHVVLQVYTKIAELMIGVLEEMGWLQIYKDQKEVQENVFNFRQL